MKYLSIFSLFTVLFVPEGVQLECCSLVIGWSAILDNRLRISQDIHFNYMDNDEIPN